MTDYTGLTPTQVEYFNTLERMDPSDRMRSAIDMTVITLRAENELAELRRRNVSRN